MKFISLLTFLLLQVTFAVASEYSAPVVKANGEELLGEWTDTAEQIAVFKGSPFARPPAGELRWRAPQPHLPRAGRHDNWLPTEEADQALTGAMEAFSTELCKMLNPAWR